jgi:hypothetical protein
LLTELEQQRKENNFLKNENAQLKTEKNHQTTRLQGLVSLLNVLDPADNARSEGYTATAQGEAVLA